MLFLSCDKHTHGLYKDLACSTSAPNNTFTKQDYQKNFSIKIPRHWKHSGFSDELQSSIMAADTLKQLSESYILDIAFKNGEITIDQNFIETFNKQIPYDVIYNAVEPFKDHASFWQVAKGTKQGYNYHVFQQVIKKNATSFIELKIELFGDQLVDERLCEALTVISTLDI
ncbi:hypothetical protein [Urechidicola sp. KH5]